MMELWKNELEEFCQCPKEFGILYREKKRTASKEQKSCKKKGNLECCQASKKGRASIQLNLFRLS
ncbi:MAG: hypothetical protein C4530_19985 [Desulfobacteraceae bacterium]|nr:MAG: hypothetical protein C4530_19985 [Desulfobacteraceae bacterium]